ncbi:ATP-binding protein, partial [Methyloglobulus sp.]|uniref:AlbA family DNA-binding domain-containing protein n=1 Tax=Methyloglobulus sp. TaxID=2518622 RepID=UPI0032B7FB4B
MKKNIDDIIEYENEHSCLDFKRSQYLKPQYGELLKDIIAMANVISEEVKLIVIGIKHLPNGVREFHSIIDKDFIDAATYQQLIRENIEPDLQVNYESYRYKDNLFGIFHLLDCSNPPYLLKKDFGDKLKKGDCFIRKGSHQTRINRSDLDKFYESKNKKPNFSEVIEIGFLNTSCFKEITIQTTNLNDLPSEVEARKIRHALENR